VRGRVSAVAETVELGAVMVVSSTSRRVEEVTDSDMVVEVASPPAVVVVVCSTVVGVTAPDVVVVCSTVVGVTAPDVVVVCSTVEEVTLEDVVVSAAVEGVTLLVVVGRQVGQWLSSSFPSATLSEADMSVAPDSNSMS
jgi:hypothetical protein